MGCQTASSNGSLGLPCGLCQILTQSDSNSIHDIVGAEKPSYKAAVIKFAFGTRISCKMIASYNLCLYGESGIATLHQKRTIVPSIFKSVFLILDYFISVLFLTNLLATMAAI